MKKLSVAVALIICAAAAYGQQSPGPKKGASQAAAAPSDAQIAPGKWDIDRVPCSSLLGASDDDRASAAMFYYGYLAAKAGMRTLDVSKISDNLGKVMKQCEASPAMTVPQAFRKALVARK